MLELVGCETIELQKTKAYFIEQLLYFQSHRVEHMFPG